MLILEDVDSSVEMDSSTCTSPRSPNDPSRKQKPVKNAITRKTSGAKLQDNKDVASIGSMALSSSVGNPLRMKRPTRQPKEPEDSHLDRIIDEILDIPKGGSDASGKNLAEVETSLRKNSTRQLKQSKDTNEINLEEAINDILEIPKFDTDSKQATKLDSLTKETKINRRKKSTSGESRGLASKSLTAQTLGNTDVPDAVSPYVSASSSSIETKNCDSGCFVVSVDTMQPMAAGSSRATSMECSASTGTVKLPFSHATRQQLPKTKQTLPAILCKEKNTVRKPRVRASRETAVLSTGSLESMATQRKAAVPVTSLNSHRTTSGIFYESDEVKLMEQIERESRMH